MTLHEFKVEDDDVVLALCPPCPSKVQYIQSDSVNAWSTLLEQDIFTIRDSRASSVARALDGYAIYVQIKSANAFREFEVINPVDNLPDDRRLLRITEEVDKAFVKQDCVRSS